MYQQKAKAANPQRAKFIRNIVDAAGIKVTRARIMAPGRDGRHYPKTIGFGFTRFVTSPTDRDYRVLERSARTYVDEDAAYEAAHAHYRLRAA